MEVGLALVVEPALDTLPLIVHPIFLYIPRLHTALTGRVNKILPETGFKSRLLLSEQFIVSKLFEFSNAVLIQ